MFLITNREIHTSETGLDMFGKKPNPKGPMELRIAELTRRGRGWQVDIIPDKVTTAMKREAGITKKWLTDMNYDPEAPLTGSIYAAKRILDRVNPPDSGSTSTRRKGRNVLFFVHGYNNNVPDVVTRAAAFEKEFNVEVIAFTWPANGGGISGVASYLSDKNDAKVSVPALDRTLAKIGDILRRSTNAWLVRIREKAEKKHPDNPEERNAMIARLAEKECPFNISMLLHSMGNYLYKHLLLSTASVGRDLAFDNVILAAADTNNKEHPLWVDQIRARRRIFITINENDHALRAARMKAGDEQLARLGHYPYNLDSNRAVYVDFTRTRGVRKSHAYFEGPPLNTAGVRTFFNDAVNGKPADQRLDYDVARNLHFVK